MFSALQGNAKWFPRCCWHGLFLPAVYFSSLTCSSAQGCFSCASGQWGRSHWWDAQGDWTSFHVFISILLPLLWHACSCLVSILFLVGVFFCLFVLLTCRKSFTYSYMKIKHIYMFSIIKLCVYVLRILSNTHVHTCTMCSFFIFFMALFGEQFLIFM